LNTLPSHGWAETGTGGDNQVYSSFGAFTAWSGNSVLLTTVGEGIYQKLTGTVAGKN